MAQTTMGSPNLAAPIQRRFFAFQGERTMKVMDCYPVQDHIGGMPLSKSLALILGSWLIGYPIAAFIFISDSAVH
jgi:hypothetical protein